MQNLIGLIKFLLMITVFTVFVAAAMVISIGRGLVIVTSVIVERRHRQLATVRALPQRSEGSAARAERIEIASVVA